MAVKLTSYEGGIDRSVTYTPWPKKLVPGKPKDATQARLDDGVHAKIPKWLPGFYWVLREVYHSLVENASDELKDTLVAPRPLETQQKTGEMLRDDAKTVMEFQMGLIDRGADLSWLSQYPHEVEVLFAPLAGLEAREMRIDTHPLNGKHIIVVSMRISINLTNPTIEQVVSNRSKICCLL